MNRVHLVLAIHGHQPVGNFESAFEQATELCYQPLLAALERAEGVRLALHFSGPLYDWFELHRPRLLDRLARLVERGRVELLGGGYFEPLLFTLPEADALGQLERMAAYQQRRFGVRPTGCWLAERVWEPELTGLLTRSGVAYTLVEDHVIAGCGLLPGALSGSYVTDRGGVPLALFPIDRRLRSAIQSRTPAEVIDQLRARAAEGGRMLTWAEDGERFGLWPGAEPAGGLDPAAWLPDFFEALTREADWLQLLTPAAALQLQPPRGRVYPASGSYPQLEAWALGPEAGLRLAALRDDLARAGLLERAEPFLRGAPWSNFLVKYPEADSLLRRMWLTSGKLAEAEAASALSAAEVEAARTALYRGQCGSALWHGSFGGLYLPHLRDALARSLIEAERIVDRAVQGDEDWIAFDQRDLDGDRADEFVVENAALGLIIDPAAGGAITSIDYRPAGYNLTNVLARHAQPTHRVLVAPTGDPEPDRPLLRPPAVDRWPRNCGLDRFPAAATRLEDLQQAAYLEEGDFLAAPYRVERASIDEQGSLDFTIELTRQGRLERDGQRRELVLEKRIAVPVDRPEIRVDYRLRNPADEPLTLTFCPEWNLNLVGGDEADRQLEFEGVIGPGPRLRSAGEVEDASWFALVDLERRIRLRLEFDPPTLLWRHPIETLSERDGGWERLAQGVALGPRWELTLGPRSSAELAVRFEVQPLDEDAVVPLPGQAEDEST